MRWMSGRSDHRWASGTYLDFFLAAALMTFVYIVAMCIILLDRPDWYDANSALLNQVSALVVGMGWLSAVLLGLGFDIIPLVHGVNAFDQGILRICVGLNIAGQVALLGAVLSFDAVIIQRVGIFGATMLSLQFMIIGPSAYRTFSGRKRGDDSVSGFTHTLPLIMPFFGCMVLLSWILIESEHSQVLFRTAFVEGFWSLILMSVLLGHFNRRLDWNIVPNSKTRGLFKLLVGLVTLHIILTLLRHDGHFTAHWTRYSYALILAVITVSTRPDITLRKAWSENLPHSAPILAAQMMIPYAAVMAFLEAKHGEAVYFLEYSNHMILLGVLPMALWGFAMWVHQDHCHAELRGRRDGRIMLTNLIIATGFYFWLGLNDLGLASEPTWLRPTTMVFAMIGLSCPAVWWLRETIFDPPEWHRIPMFYGTLNEGEDPYELSPEP